MGRLDCQSMFVEEDCRAYGEPCDWAPFSFDGGVAVGSLELPDGGLPDGPVPIWDALACAPPPHFGIDPGAACSALEASGPCVPLTQTQEPAPVAAGGELVPGTYELVASKAYYGLQPDDRSPRRRTMVITGVGDSYHAETIAMSSTRSEAASFDFAVGSSFLAVRAMCPSTQVAEAKLDYTASGKFLLLYERVYPRAGLAGTLISMFERR